MTVREVQDFVYVFFPFMFGIYPYTYVTEKQREGDEKRKDGLRLPHDLRACVLLRAGAARKIRLNGAFV